MNQVSILLISVGVLLILVLVATHLVSRGWVRFQPTIRGARRRLERGLGLGFRDRRLLDRLARALDLEERTPLLLGRGCFEEAVRRLDPPEALLARIESLRHRIHQGLPSDPA